MRRVKEVELSEVMEFWDRQPCNLKHGRAPVGTQTYFNEVSRKRYRAEPHIRDFADFPAWSGKKVLEIGCGIGTDGAEFARNGAHYTAVELSRESLEIAASRFEVEGLRGRFGQANVERLDSELSHLEYDDNYDLIYSFGVLHHTPNLDKALRGIRSVSGPQTEIRIMVYAANSLKSALIQKGLAQPEAQEGCPVANTYSKGELVELFRESGLQITEISQDHIFQWELEEYKKGRFVKLPWFEAMPKSIYESFASVAGWHLLIKARRS